MLVVLLGLLATPAAAWGPDGHRLAGQIAWLRLDPPARTRISRLLPAPGEHGGDYSTLAEASTWADLYARQSGRHDWAAPLHYVNVDPWAEAYVRNRDCPNGSDCVVEAIHRFSAVVADHERPQAERSEALLFLIHFVQDIHQPLHVAHPDNRGGSDTQVYWFGRERNLHQVWDDGLTARFLKRTYHWEWLLGEGWQRHAATLAGDPPPPAWLSATTPERWATESLSLAREHTYQVGSNMSLGSAYYHQTADVAFERIHQAGVRLADLLERSVTSK